jgi:hypothetical protein
LEVASDVKLSPPACTLLLLPLLLLLLVRWVAAWLLGSATPAPLMGT